MSTDYFAVLTNIGAAKLANAAATNTQLSLVMAVGDGVGDGAQGTPVPDPARVQLVSERRRAPLNGLSVDPVNANVIIAEQILPPDVGGFWIRELALFDESGDMIAIANAPPTYKPILTSGAGRTQVVRMHLVVSNTAAVSLRIDPNVFLASRAWVLEQFLVDSRWVVINAPQVLAAGKRYNLRGAGLFSLPSLASTQVGDSVTISKAFNVQPQIRVADSSVITTHKGPAPDVVLAGNTTYEFIRTATGWEV